MLSMTGDWQRLAQYAMRRRAELGLTQLEVAQRGPLSLDRVQSVEGAKRDKYRLGTLLALERALEWEADSVEAILAGGVPTVRVAAGAVEQADPSMPVRRIVEGRMTAGTGGPAGKRHLTPIEGGNEAPVPDEFGLGDEPPFPGVTHNSSGYDTPARLNRVWEIAKEMEATYYQEREAKSDSRKLRAIQQYELAAKALIDELDSAG